jgi:hypothetical protein
MISISNILEVFVDGKYIGVCDGVYTQEMPEPPFPVDIIEASKNDTCFEVEFESLYSYSDHIKVNREFAYFGRHIKHISPNKSQRFRLFGSWAILIQRRTRITEHHEHAYIYVKNGTYILPKDGSYIRYISNSWYE